MKNILFILMLFLAQIALGQNTSYDFDDLGIFPSAGNAAKTTINQDSKLNEIVKNHITSNTKHANIPGWRVQIFQGTGHQAREKAAGAKAEFEKEFPDIDAYQVYETPYFKIKIGDCRTKYDAFRLKKKVESSFSNSWVVEDRINFPKL